MEVIHFGSAERYEPEKDWRRVSLCNQEDISIEHVLKPPGHASPRHEHANAQVLIVLKGKLVITTDDDEQELCENDEKHMHLIVQAMEAWLMADRDKLKSFYGRGFDEGKLPDDDVEDIPKKRLLIALRAATRDSDKGRYHKTRHGFQILGTLDTSRVSAAAPHCERLFQVLEKEVGIFSE